MILYNVTFQVDSDIETQWTNWVQKTYIPKMLSDNGFSSAQLLRVRTEEGAITGSYALQFSAADKKQFDLYMTQHSAIHRQEILEQFGTKALIFSTQLEIISTHQ